MIAARAFRTFALGLAGTEELPHFDRASFRVGGKIFATLTRDGDEAMVRVPDPARVESLLDDPSGAFFSYGGWTVRNGSLGVRLAKVDAALARELLRAAWETTTPKRRVPGEGTKRSKPKQSRLRAPKR